MTGEAEPKSNLSEADELAAQNLRDLIGAGLVEAVREPVASGLLRVGCLRIRGGPARTLCYCRFVRLVDRPCARSPPAEKHRARHGFEREPDPWRAGDERLERALRLHLLSSAVRVQPVR